VIKLGGSLAKSPELPAWLALLAAPAVPCVVVPGGGPYADVVRQLQAHWRFADIPAHALAILAMGLYGRTLATLAPGLRVADSLAAVTRLVDAGAVSVIWCPGAVDLSALAELPADWSVTSDSMALWLAGHVGIARVGLVKSCPVAARSLDEMARDAAVDACFPRLAATLPVQLAWFEAHAWADAAKVMQGLIPMRPIR
jgi:aspartokinase-like uncharacterized kinase